MTPAMSDDWIGRIVAVVLLVLLFVGVGACMNVLKRDAREECARKGGTFVVSDGMRGESWTCFPKGMTP